MGLESGSFLDDLVASNPGSGDDRSVGDDHIRLIKSVLRATFKGATRAFQFPNVNTAKTGAYTITLTDENALIRGNASGGAFTFTLPLGSTIFAGYEVTVMKVDSSNNTLTVDGAGSETIDGATTSLFTLQYTSKVFVWDGSEWKIIAASIPGLIIGTDVQAHSSVLDGISAAGEVSLPFNHIGGLTLSTDTDTAHDVNITAGAARDPTNAQNISLSSEITKQIDVTWAVGDNAGGLDTGAVANTSLYAVWLILRSDTGVVDVLFSLSFSTPSMPTDYDFKRLIGFVKTDGSANIINFLHSGDYFRFIGDVVADVSDSTVTTSFETGTLSVPPLCLAHVYMTHTSGTGKPSGWMRTKGAADAADTTEAMFQWSGSFVDTTTGDPVTENITTLATGASMVMTDGSSQIEYAGTSSSTITISTFGCQMLTRTNP